MTVLFAKSKRIAFTLAVSFLLLTNINAQNAGALDDTFGSTGCFYIEVGDEFSRTRDMVVQNDGKIVVGGSSIDNGIVVHTLVRFNVDGTTDDSFGLEGVVLTPIGLQAGIDAMALQDDGKIVTAGVTVPESGIFDASVVRYNTDGSLDVTFGTNGIATVNVENALIVQGIAIQNDGKIVITGYSGEEGMAVGISHVRFNNDGSIDESFGENGMAIVKFQQSAGVEAWAMVLDAGDNIITAGTMYDVEQMHFNITVARFTPEGAPDESFGEGGLVVTSVDNGDDFGNDLVVQTDGKILVVASVQQDAILIRYNADGTIDNTFGTEGIASINFGENESEAYAIALQDDGCIVVAGVSGTNAQNTNGNFGLMRFFYNGVPDSNFGNNGRVITDITMGNNDVANTLGMCPNDKIVAAGVSYNGSCYNISVARYYGISTMLTNTSSDGISLFPNPAGHSFMLNLEQLQNFDNNVIAEIIDLQGKSIIKTNVTGEFTEIFLDDIENGFYTLKLSMNDKIFKKRFCVIKP